MNPTFRRLAGIALLSMLSGAVMADSAAESKVDAASLGRLDALLAACAKADAKNQATYARLRADLIVFGEGTQFETKVEVSTSPEYKAAYDAAVAAAGKATAEELRGQCRRSFGAPADEGG